MQNSISSAINTRFRQLTLNTPSLWTHITLPLPLDIFSLFVARAQPHKLDLTIHPGEIPLSALLALRQHLQSHSVLSLCQSLTVTKCAHFLLPEILALPWPLRALDIELCAFDDDYDCPAPPYDDEWCVDLLRGRGEELHDLRLLDVPFNWTRLALRDLHILHLTFPSATWAVVLPSIQQFLDTLSSLPLLTQLMLDNLKFEETVNGTHVPFHTKRAIVHLPALRNVSLCGPTLHHLRLFLPFLRPSPSCALHLLTARTHIASDLFVPLAPTFFGRITHLSLCGIGDQTPASAAQVVFAEHDFFVLGEEVILRSVRQMPQLKWLTVDLLRLPDSLFRQLSRPAGTDPPAPGLEGIRILRSHGFGADQLGRMILSRRGMRYVSVEMCPEVGEIPLWEGVSREWPLAEEEDDW
ncbi:hypothetical protein DACRYDRAFT_111249 [Dacryopinax primogenitus]|uniref:F-box domain-containing protein n=1 Tax=Dacryopinax primogenitus (strain DJM 731) TaxID=1858805 RepID=M5G3D8_DACPD|nr:uncharacterized protein DACRYDRAFT_111249 [Dacryopinax primogenitus]EJT98277.1 hypothetical protein DACRYDRAFT_111249 [Dacryopinax primogenitus]